MSVESRRELHPAAPGARSASVPSSQPIVVWLQPDLSSVERKVEELAAKLDTALAFLRPPGTYTVAQAAELLQVDPKRVYEAIQQRRIRAVQIGRQWRIPTAPLLEWLETGDAPAAVREEQIRLEPPRRRGSDPHGAGIRPR